MESYGSALLGLHRAPDGIVRSSSFYPLYLLGVWQRCLEPSTHSCLCPRPGPPELATIRALQGLGMELWVFETPCLDTLCITLLMGHSNSCSKYPKSNGVKPPPFYFCPFVG